MTLNKTLNKTRPRRIVAILLMLLGGLMLWFAPETLGGVVLLIVGLVIEAIGIFLDHRSEKKSKSIS